jgi:putative nucleotidyltransferase with HDIG domain
VRPSDLDKSQKIARALTLLRVFVLVSAVVFAAAAFVLGTVMTRALRAQAIDDAKVSLTQYTNAVLSDELAHGRQVVVTPFAEDVLRRSVAARPEVLSLKVWRPDGVLVWTNLEPERIGKRFEGGGGHVAEVMESGTAEAELEELNAEEDKAEAALGFDDVLEVYAPIRNRYGRVVGAFEIYAESSSLEASIADRKRTIWQTTGVVFALVALLLFLLVGGASKALRRQTETVRQRSKALMEAYARLEESSLEAIESLNATVEAKDPYTAGHSLRVQRIAVALGEQLRLDKPRMDALRFGALFHDIGKLAVPDAVLTKPALLTDEEYDVVKAHSSDGARIVGKFSRLRESVSIIEHHHERWDGRGYPAGLSAEAIPLEAAIVGLADAWDAMTTERPYHRALSLQEACAEIRNGKGTQFAPKVVEAFFVTLNRRPGQLFAGEDEPGATLHIAERARAG